MYKNNLHYLYDWRWFSMIKQIAWNTFKNTGDINTFLELVEVKNIEKNMIEAEKQNGNIEVKGNSYSGTQYERL